MLGHSKRIWGALSMSRACLQYSPVLISIVSRAGVKQFQLNSSHPWLQIRLWHFPLPIFKYLFFLNKGAEQRLNRLEKLKMAACGLNLIITYKHIQDLTMHSKNSRTIILFFSDNLSDAMRSSLVLICQGKSKYLFCHSFRIWSHIPKMLWYYPIFFINAHLCVRHKQLGPLCWKGSGWIFLDALRLPWIMDWVFPFFLNLSVDLKTCLMSFHP